MKRTIPALPALRSAARILAAGILILMIPAAGMTVGAEDGTQEEQAMNHGTFEISIDSSYSGLRADWEEQQAENGGNVTYRITVLGSAEQAGSAVLPEEVLYTGGMMDYTYAMLLDYIAYACQEQGIPGSMRIRIDAASDGEVFASGYTDAFDPRAFYPEKEELILGEDVLPEEICGFDYIGFADYVDGNFSYSIRKTEDGILYYASSPKINRDREIERKLSKTQWDRLMELIARGRIVRSRVDDPEMEVLDGSGSWMDVRWEGMTEMEKAFYSFAISGADRTELEDFLTEAAQSSSRAPVIAGVAVTLAAGIAGAVAARIRRKR